MKRNSLLSLLACMALLACSKDLEQDKISTHAVTNVKDLKVSKDFDWKTTHLVTIDITGVKGGFDQPRPIRVAKMNGDLILSKMVSMADNESLKFELPKSEKAVIVSFGEIVKEVNLSGNHGHFDYFRKNTEEEYLMGDEIDKIVETERALENLNK